MSMLFLDVMILLIRYQKVNSFLDLVIRIDTKNSGIEVSRLIVFNQLHLAQIWPIIYFGQTMSGNRKS